MLYLAAIPLVFVNSWLACDLYVLVVVLWFIPDIHIGKTLNR